MVSNGREDLVPIIQVDTDNNILAHIRVQSGHTRAELRVSKINNEQLPLILISSFISHFAVQCPDLGGNVRHSHDIVTSIKLARVIIRLRIVHVESVAISPSLIRELTTILLIFPCSLGPPCWSQCPCNMQKYYWRENVTLDPVTVSHSLNGTNNGSYKYFVVTRELFLLPR